MMKAGEHGDLGDGVQSNIWKILYHKGRTYALPIVECLHFSYLRRVSFSYRVGENLAAGGPKNVM